MISDFLLSSDNSQEVIDFDKLQKLPSDSPIYEFYVARLWHKKVFIKKLKQEHQNNPFYLAALKKEFEIGVSLNHPSIPVYRDYKNGVVIIDFIDGEPLSKLIKVGKSQENSKNLKKIIVQLIDAVDYLHRNNVIHCDIKADNILITRGSGNVMLIDFDKCHTDSYDNTRANPEVFGIEKNAEVDSELDLYQISLIIKEMLPLFSRKERKQLVPITKALRKDKVDLDKIKDLLYKKTITEKVITLGWVFLPLVLAVLGILIFIRPGEDNTLKKEVYETYPKNIDAVDSADNTSIINKNVLSTPESEKESHSEEKVLNPEFKKNTIESNEEIVSPSFEKEPIETLINRRMEVLLKPYAEYLNKYEEAVDTRNIPYEELTSIAQNSNEMLVKSMQEACNNLYKEFPEIEKEEIQKIAWLSPPYLNLVNRNIEISERYGKRVLEYFNQ